MGWTVNFYPELVDELDALSESTQTVFLASAKRLEEYGPSLGRPWVDTLNASKHANMKELRFRADGGVWRVAFAFDPKQQAILLVACEKKGKSQNRFYKRLIKVADQRYDSHLVSIAE